MKKDNNINISHNESGVALIFVMSIMVLIALLAASITTLALISNQISKVTCDMDQSVYLAEGALDRTIWLLRNDRKLHPTRSLGNVDYVAGGDDLERYMADGLEHKLDYYDGKVTVSILDAAVGKDISDSPPTKNLVRTQASFGDDYEKWERYKLILGAIKDYVDTNDMVQLNGGMEFDDYVSIGLEPLPRNDKFEFREELLLIPGAEEFFLPDRNGVVSSLRIIPSKGLQTISGKDNFYSTNNDSFASDAQLESSEIDAVIDARKLWITEGIPLSDSLDPNLLAKINAQYSMRESGYYTFLIKAQPGANLPGKVLTCTLMVPINLVSGKDFQFYEWQFLQ